MTRNTMTELKITIANPKFELGLSTGFIMVLETRNNSILPAIDY